MRTHRTGPSLREQWRETTNREAIVLLPLVLLVVGIVYGSIFIAPEVWVVLSWPGLLAACGGLALLIWMLMARSMGYAPLTSAPTASVWHISSAPDLVDAKPGDTVTLDVSRCRRISRIFDHSRPWSGTRQAVYFFAGPPTEASAVANVSGPRRARATLLELDAAGLQAPLHRRGTAIASTSGYHGRLLSTTPLSAVDPETVDPRDG